MREVQVLRRIEIQVAVLVGSLRHESFNRKLADTMAALAPSTFSFRQLHIGDLPLYDQHDDANPPYEVQRLKAELAAAQGVLFVTPEYNRSIPGVLKNAIDHASRPHGQNSFAGKPAGVLGASVAVIGSAMAQQRLRDILANLKVPTLARPEAFVHAHDGVFDGSGNLGDASRTFLQGWMNHYVAWVRQHAAT